MSCTILQWSTMLGFAIPFSPQMSHILFAPGCRRISSVSGTVAVVYLALLVVIMLAGRVSASVSFTASNTFRESIREFGAGEAWVGWIDTVAVFILLTSLKLVFSFRSFKCPNFQLAVRLQLLLPPYSRFNLFAVLYLARHPFEKQLWQTSNLFSFRKSM